MKRHLILFATFCLVALYGCELPSATEQHSNPQKPQQPQDETEIAILSVNDMHASIDMFPKFATMVDSLRRFYPNLLLFSAGDNRTGNPVNDQYVPVNYPMITLMNEVGFDICAVGNHEWDANVVNLKNDIERAEFPFICANVFVPDSVDISIKPMVIMEHQGVKMAVVGMIEVGRDGIPSAHPQNLTKVSFKSPGAVLPEYQYLREENDVVLLLSHCGFDVDVELATANPWLDAIIGGHSHTLVDKPSETNGVLITQSGSHLKYATLVKLRVKGHKVVSKEAVVFNVNEVVGEKPEIKQLVNKFNDAPELNEPIAVAKTKFETPQELGCLMTDAVREMSGADFAFQNTGGVRVKNLNNGPITVKDVYCIDPFNNDVVVFDMTGAQVKKFIMNSYRKNGGHLSYVSGMTCSIDDDGKNVWVEMEGEDFSTKKMYKVAMNSYMASTVDIDSEDEGHSMFMTSEEMMIAFLKKQKEVDYQGVVRTR